MSRDINIKSRYDAGSPLFDSHKYQRALLFEKLENRDYVNIVL